MTDVSYIYSQEGRMYLSVIKDLYDNSIIACQISKYNDLRLVIDNLMKAVGDNWDPTHFCVLHSDHGITVSHSGKANCYDNACCGNFFGHLKSESLELHDLPKIMMI